MFDWILFHIEVDLEPKAEKAPTHAKAINPMMRPYSMAVAAQVDMRTRFKSLIMMITLVRGADGPRMAT